MAEWPTFQTLKWQALNLAFLPRAGTRAVGIPGGTAAGDRGDGLVCACEIDGPDTMIAEISDIERAAGCRCAARKFEPCRCARAVGMCAETANITPYDRADSRRGCVNGTDGMRAEIRKVERITA